MSDRVVLAYSGGLDTSVAIPYLAEQTGAEVIAVAVDVGEGGEDMEVIRNRALACGAAEAEVVDAREEFAADFCLPALRANALYMDRYPLVSALSRPLIVKHLVAAAQAHGGTIVSHGCTGKGNDQVRFEAGIAALAPHLKVVAPARDFAWTRDKAIRYAQENGLPIDVTPKSPYSIDQNVWGRAVETGFLEDIWNAPVEDLYSYTADPSVPRDPDTVVITFDGGRPVAIDGETLTPYQIITELNRRAGAQGVGRLDMVEDRLVGIKSREVYEAPAAIALIAAHQELESVTVERDVARFKRTVDQRWSELVYDGLWFSPLKAALDAFIAETQRHVSGEVRLTLHGGRATVTGRRSEASLYDFGLATYDEGDMFDQSLAKGFVDLWGLPSRLAAARDDLEAAGASGESRPGVEDEDVHRALEGGLLDRLGALGGKLRAGRSRNDQVATDLRLYLRDRARGVAARLVELADALTEQAARHVDTPAPGMTHLQHAQPVTFGHQLLAHVQALLRDLDRMRDWDKRAAVSPLGAGALAGSSLPLDPVQVAQELGFASAAPNSIDAVSDRDFVAEFLFVAALTGVHLSRLGEEIVLWTTPEFGWVDLDDAFATGSSIKRPRKNPGNTPHAPGQTGRSVTRVNLL